MAQKDLSGDSPKFVLELDVLEKQWVRKAIDVLRGVLTRSRLKELPGSEIHAMRGREIESLTNLLNKVS